MDREGCRCGKEEIERDDGSDARISGSVYTFSGVGVAFGVGMRSGHGGVGWSGEQSFFFFSMSSFSVVIIIVGGIDFVVTIVIGVWWVGFPSICSRFMRVA